MKPVISISDLAKQYVLGAQFKPQASFREMALNAIASPVRNFKRLRGSDSEQPTFWALKDINFSVQAGEVVGVIGRNGAGKSTLLKVLSRITSPTKGHIEYQGRLASLLEVGTGFHPELTGRENIYLNGAILGMSRNEINAQLDDIIEFAEIEKFLDTPVKRYSSGMYVRLAFSVAAHLSPDILVVDEVLAVGDQAFQQKCLGKLKDTAGDGRTVFFVSHNMTAVRNLCSRIIYLKDGQIEYDGDPDTAIAMYLSVDKSDSALWSDQDDQLEHLKQIRLFNASEINTNLFQYNENIDVSIELQNKKNGTITPAVRITDVFGNVLFTSWDKDFLGDYTKASRQTLVCSIPAELLKPSNYILTVFVHSTNENGERIFEEANLDITISPEHCPIDSGRLGLLFPTLKWKSANNEPH